MTLAHAGRIPAGSMEVPFDYSRAIFGNEHMVGIGAGNWGAVRMGRCLESLTTVRGRVLEVGCVAGRCIRTIRHCRPALEACGCDLSAPAIGTARAHGDGVRCAVSNAGQRRARGFAQVNPEVGVADQARDQQAGLVVHPRGVTQAAILGAPRPRVAPLGAIGSCVTGRRT